MDWVKGDTLRCTDDSRSSKIIIYIDITFDKFAILNQTKESIGSTSIDHGANK